MKPVALWKLLAAFALGFGAGGGQLPTIGLPDVGWILPVGQTAPYATKVPSCLVVEETNDRRTLTTEQLDVLTATGDGSVRKYCKDHGIDFQLLDKDNATGMDSDWAKAAFEAAKDKPTPWLIAANSRTGGSVAITNTASALAILSRIGSK